ncbi:MAG: tripartite tricarboxylate transporter TctB family protein [Alphaproteobacteria bacterium]
MDSNNAAGEARGNWLRTNRGVGACLVGIVILLLIYLSTEDWIYQVLRDGFRLGFFSVISAFTMLLCSAALLFDRHRNVVEEDVAKAGRFNFIVPVVAVLVCYAYFELAWNIDFLLITPVFMFAATWFLGVRPMRSAAIAGIVMTLVIFGLFWSISIYLPTSIISI